MVSLYQTFMDFSVESQDDEVCSNSIFGLGVLAKFGVPEMLGYVSVFMTDHVKIVLSYKITANPCSGP